MKKEKKSLILSGPCHSAPFVKPAAALWLGSRPVLQLLPVGPLLLFLGPYDSAGSSPARPAFRNSNPSRRSEPTTSPKDPSPPRVFKRRLLCYRILSPLPNPLLSSPLPADQPDSSALGPGGESEPSHCSARLKGVGGERAF